MTQFRCTLVKGHMQDGKFHPHTQTKGVSKHSRVRYANDQGSVEQTNIGVKEFAKKIKQRHEQFKANQKEMFNRELQVRRKFEGKLIIAFRLGRSQGVNNSRKMEKFIRQQIPDLPDDKQTNKFVVKVLRDFLDREKELEKRKQGKSTDEKKALQVEFEDSLEKSKIMFESLQAQQESEFAKELNETVKKKNAENKKLQEQNEKLQKKAKEDEEKARKTAKDESASQQERQKAEQQAQQSEKQADQAEEKQQDFAQEVFDELKTEEKKIQTETEDVGFPEGII